MNKNVSLLVLSALIFSLLIMGVFAEDWPMFMHDSNHTSSNGENYAISSLTFTQMANFSTGNIAVGDTLVSSPAVYDGMIYVGLDNYTYVLNATTLSQTANFTTGDGFIESSPAVSNGIVYIGSGGSSNYDVYALNATDLTQMANFTSGGYYHSSPTISDGIVYILSTDGNIYALNATNLNQIANFSTGSAWSSPAVSNGIVYIGSDNGNVYALNATDLTKIANFSASASFDSSPSVSNGIVYIAGDNLYALNATTMNQIANASITALFTSSPSISNGIVYVGTEQFPNGEVYALNATTLNQIANFTTGNLIFYASPAVSNGIVYIGAGIRSSNNGNVYALNATNLNQIANFSAGYYISSPAVSNGIVYVGSDFNDVYALSLNGISACIPPFDGMFVSQSTNLCNGTYSLANGTYSDMGITVNTSNVVLVCNQTVLTGNGVNGFGVNILNVDNITVENCSITGFYDPLYINNSIGDLILDNNIMNNPQDGLIAVLVSNSLFSNNIIENNAIGLDLTSFFNNTVSNNLLSNNGEIYLHYSENSNFINNTVIGGFAALDVSFYTNSSLASFNNLFSGNTIMNATYGVYIDPSAFNNTFSSNIFSNNNNHDIWTSGSGLNTLIVSNGTNQVTFYNKLDVTNMSDIFINDAIVAVNSDVEPALNVSANVSLVVSSCSLTLFRNPGFFEDIASAYPSATVCTAPTCTNITCAGNLMNFTVNSFSTYFASSDTTSPSVTLISPPLPSIFYSGDIITLAINATDNVAVNTAYANISQAGVPFVYAHINLSENGASEMYNGTFNTSNKIKAAYNVTFFVNDTSNNVNSSVITNFVIVSPPVISSVYFNSTDTNPANPANLGNITFNTTFFIADLFTNESVTMGLPNTVTNITPGNYTMTYTPLNSSYVFESWNVAGNVNITNSTSLTTDVSVTGNGTVTVVYAYDEVVANFTPTSPGAPLFYPLDEAFVNQTINFTDSSYSSYYPITNWTWDFGDGNTSNLQNLMYGYQNTGQYNVTLTVVDSNGASNTSSAKVITIIPIPPPQPLLLFNGVDTNPSNPANLGNITFSGLYAVVNGVDTQIGNETPLPFNITGQPPGNYTLNYTLLNSSYVFFSWNTTGNVSVTDPTSPNTNISVFGNGGGTVNAVYSYVIPRTGGGGSNPVFSTPIPTPPPVTPPPQQPPSQPVSEAPSPNIGTSISGANLNVNEFACTHFGSTQVTHQSAVQPSTSIFASQIKKGYSVIVPPFKVNCDQSSFSLQLSIPDSYTNVTALRCSGTGCSQVTINTVTTLDCNGNQYQTITRNISVLPPELFPVPLTEVISSPGQNAVSSGHTKVVFAGKAQGTLSIGKPSTAIPEAKNPSIQIVGTPTLITFDAKSVNAPINVTLPYVSQNNIDELSIAEYAFTNNQWIYLGGNPDTSSKTVTLTVQNPSQYTTNNTMSVALMGLICQDCEKSSLNEVYNGSSRDAVILVHGFETTPARFQDMINDFELTNQPWQVWTYGYPSDKTIDNDAKMLADFLQENNDKYDYIYFVGHSLGGVIVQDALNYAYTQDQETQSQKYSFLNKVQKVISIAAPNNGTTLTQISGAFNYLLNSNAVAQLFSLNSVVMNDLLAGKQIPRVSGIDYLVIAGTQPYPLFNSITQPNDGLVLETSAQDIGGIPVNDYCTDFWAINATHTDLLNNFESRQIIESIISKEVSNTAGTNQPLLGHSYYYQLSSSTCTPDTEYMIIGTPLQPAAQPSPGLCNCGNGVCGVGKTPENCPSDCAVIQKPSSNLLLFLWNFKPFREALIGAIAVIAILALLLRRKEPYDVMETRNIVNRAKMMVSRNRKIATYLYNDAVRAYKVLLPKKRKKFESELKKLKQELLSK